MFLEQQISILEGSWNIEDWSNDAENSALPSQNLITYDILKKEYSYFKL